MPEEKKKAENAAEKTGTQYAKASRTVPKLQATSEKAQRKNLRKKLRRYISNFLNIKEKYLFFLNDFADLSMDDFGGYTGF